MVVMISLIIKLKTRKDSGIQWHMQAGNLITNLRVKVYFIIP